MSQSRCSVVLAMLLVSCSERRTEPSSLAIGDVLGGGGGDTAGFARAIEPPALVFPADHGSHPSFRTEWWYVTGNVEAANGVRFGLQLVFFRQALAANSPARTATLAARDVVLAHAAVTDIGRGVFHVEERMERLAGGLAEIAGPAAEPFRIVCADWSLRAAASGDGFLPLDLHANGREFSFSLRASAGKPPVLQGDRGLSRKGDEPGNASVYYSMTRLPLEGVITVAGVEHAVRGLGWLDREWSTSALGAEQVGWDWLALQLDSGEEIMWYRLRRRDGSSDPRSSGSLVHADATVTALDAARVVVSTSGTWRAPDGRSAYPSQWRLQGSDPAFDLEITPLVADQELRTLVRYWEGAVAVRGTRDGKLVAGRGYLEMTGYVRNR